MVLALLRQPATIHQGALPPLPREQHARTLGFRRSSDADLLPAEVKRAAFAGCRRPHCRRNPAQTTSPNPSSPEGLFIIKERASSAVRGGVEARAAGERPAPSRDETREQDIGPGRHGKNRDEKPQQKAAPKVRQRQLPVRQRHPSRWSSTKPAAWRKA